MKRETKVKMARAAAAGLVLVATTTMAAPGWAAEQELKQEAKQEQGQKSEPKQKEVKTQKGRENRRDKHGAAVMAARMIGHDLRLSRDQSNSLRDVLRQHAVELKSNAHEIGETHRLLREKEYADTFDEAAIRSAAELYGAAIGSSSLIVARIAAEIRPVLSPEQRTRLRKVSDRWEARLDRWRGRLEHWDGE